MQLTVICCIGPVRILAFSARTPYPSSKHVQLTVHIMSVQLQSRPGATTVDLFDAKQEWLTSPVLAFSSWLSSFDDDEKKRLRPGTKTVYISMWSKFTGYLAGQGISLWECRSHHIARFLDDHGLEKHHRQRYVRLIERAFAHLIEIQVVSHNPGSKAGYESVGKGSNDPTRFLTHAERERLFARLQKALAHAACLSIKEFTPQFWIAFRDVVVVASMVGAGLKVSEVVSLTVNCTSQEGKLIVPDESGQRHLARLLPIAQDALSIWWPWRERMADGIELVFPSDIKRRRSDRQVNTAAMHPATVYRRVAALLEDAGITGDRACCQTLRNTYAAILIEQGASDAELRECLGQYADRSAQRIREAYLQWQKRPPEHR